jgi:hypothetical protein
MSYHFSFMPTVSVQSARKACATSYLSAACCCSYRSLVEESLSQYIPLQIWYKELRESTGVSASSKLSRNGRQGEARVAISPCNARGASRQRPRGICHLAYLSDKLETHRGVRGRVGSGAMRPFSAAITPSSRTGVLMLVTVVLRCNSASAHVRWPRRRELASHARERATLPTLCRRP